MNNNGNGKLSKILTIMLSAILGIGLGVTGDRIAVEHQLATMQEAIRELQYERAQHITRAQFEAVSGEIMRRLDRLERLLK